MPMATSSYAIVSVIIPTYNRAYCLPAALDGLLRQTYPYWEAILIDDGSSDGTGEMIARRYGSEPRIRYFAQKNRGVSAARNHGLSLATGGCIAFLDSDDVWEPWKLALQMAAFRRHPELGMCWTDMSAVSPSGELVSPAYLRTMYRAYQWFPTAHDLFDASEEILSFAGAEADWEGRRLYLGDIFSQMFMGSLVHTSTVVMTRECATRVGGFREDWRFTGEDFHFHLRTCREAKVGYLDVSSICYQIGMQDALTRPSYNVHCAEAFCLTLEEFLQKYPERIHLPQHMLNATLAYAHLWLGEELLLNGNRSRGCAEIVTSLRHAPSARAVLRLAGGCVPKFAHRFLKETYGRLRLLTFSTLFLPTKFWVAGDVDCCDLSNSLDLIRMAF